MIRGARAAKSASSWQDLRAVYPPTAICGAFRMHGAQILPEPARFRMHGVRILPRTGDSPRPRPLLGCMRRKNCHGLTPGNAPWRNIATDRHSGTHRARILPLPVRPRAHQGAVLPPSDAGKRISRAFCHRRAPGNAPWRNLATTSRPRTHFAHIPPSPGAWERIASISCHRQTSENAQLRHTATASCPVAQRSPREGVGSVPWLCCGVRRATLSVRGSGHSAFSGLNCWERFRVCAVSVGNHEPASRSAKLCRIMC